MRFFILGCMVIVSSLFARQVIVNETNEPMLCEARYSAVYEKEKLHGILQNVKVQEKEDIVKIIPPKGSFKRTQKGVIKCYNKKIKIESYNEFSIKKTNDYTLPSYLMQHEMFDIASYMNEDRAFVDGKYGISRRCLSYKGGEYCYKANGLDILFNSQGRVEKLFIYGWALQNGTLPLEAASIGKIRTNSELLGLWVSDKNKKLLKKRPDFVSTNTLIWNNPAPYIKRIIMTSQGHLASNSYRYGFINKNQKSKLQSKLQAIEVDYKLNDRAYKRWQKEHPTYLVTKGRNSKNVASTVPKKAKETWGKYLNPKKYVPKNRFYVVYINTTKPKEIVASETVDRVAIHYVFDKFHKIPSKDFGAYWVGDFTFAKATKRSFNISQSWAKARIIVDGTVVYEGGRSMQVPYTFSKGTHRIEVEYINNWHTTNFVAGIESIKNSYTLSTLRKKLDEVSSASSDVLYCGVYESRNQDQRILVKLQKNSKPVILLLNSYKSVQWRIVNPYKVKIDAIVYGTYKPGVEVKIADKSIPILAYKGTIGSYSMEQKCSCANSAFFHCEGSSGLANISHIETLVNRKVYGFSATYGAQVMELPNTIVTKKWKQKQRQLEQSNALARKKCQKQNNPSFEDMFQK